MKEQYGLSDREYQVLLHVALGLTNDQIARVMFRSVKTVKTQLQTAFLKLGVSNRVQAAYLTWEAHPIVRSADVQEAVRA